MAQQLQTPHLVLSLEHRLQQRVGTVATAAVVAAATLIWTLQSSVAGQRQMLPRRHPADLFRRRMLHGYKDLGLHQLITEEVDAVVEKALAAVGAA